MNLVNKLIEPLINNDGYIIILINKNDENMTHCTKRIHSSRYTNYVKHYGRDNVTLIAKEM